MILKAKSSNQRRVSRSTAAFAAVGGRRRVYSRGGEKRAPFHRCRQCARRRWTIMNVQGVVMTAVAAGGDLPKPKESKGGADGNKR
jgi:hypothetical protein